MNLPTAIVKCKCGDPVCRTYGLNVGTFYQGTGFDKDVAEEIVRRCGDPRGEFEEVDRSLGKDENYGSFAEVFDNNEEALIELLETGSVTLKMLGREFELTLNAKEVK